MSDRLTDLVAERHGKPPVGEGTEDRPTERDEATGVARRRRVLWLGMNGGDREE